MSEPPSQGSTRGRTAVLAVVAITAGLLALHRPHVPAPMQVSAVTPRGGVIVVAPATDAPFTEHLVASTADYLHALSDREVATVRLEPNAAGLAAIEQAAADHSAGLVIVLDAEHLVPSRVDTARLEDLGSSGFVVQAEDIGNFSNDLGDTGATLVFTAGGTRLSRQYAVYELLRRLGARFYHPEQEYIPVQAPTDLRALARRPTLLLREGQTDYRPDFDERSWSFHGPHPLEHLEAFSDPSHPLDEAVHVTDWIVKNFGNRFRGPGRAVVIPAQRQQRAAELDALRIARGFGRGASISLHNLQQGATAEIDADSGQPVKEQIKTIVARKLSQAPDAERFGVHFGVTEFTTTPDEQTVQWLNWVGEAVRELRPDLPVIVNNHITGSQPSPHFDDLGCPNGTNDEGRIDYYDLAFHTDPRLEIQVHTVMFYPLEGPARVYNQRSFAHKLCLMRKASAQGRPLTWFPEGSWWLSFDNPIPVYLPLYMGTRARDIELLRPLLASRGDGTLRGHRMFNSGQEWGYWQQDYAVGLMGWNADLTLAQVLGELFDPLCEPAAWREGCPARSEAVAVLQEVIEHQRDLFLNRTDAQGRAGGLYTYFAGEDPGDEIAAASGMEFRPVRPSFSEVMRWDEAKAERFVATDLAAFEEAASAYEGWTERLRLIRSSVPEPGRPWLDEVIDGVEINALRARQGHLLYSAVVELRRTSEESTQRAQQHWTQAAKVLEQARAVVRRREQAYRYPPQQTHGGGLTPAEAKDNGTPYPFRVHTKTHHLTYWTGRHAQVQALLEGARGAGLSLQGVMAAPGTALSLTWPDDETLDASLRLGSIELDPSITSLDLGPVPGRWSLEGTITRNGQARPVRGTVVRSDTLATTSKGAMTLTVPADDTAKRVLSSVVPSLRWAWLDEPASLVFAPDVDRDGRVAARDLVIAEIDHRDGSGFTTRPITFALPVALASGGASLTITLSDVVFRGRVGPQGLEDPLQLEGQISIDDIVAAAIELAGFDERGMLAILARIWDFDSDNPPKTAPIAGQFHP